MNSRLIHPCKPGHEKQCQKDPYQKPTTGNRLNAKSRYCDTYMARETMDWYPFYGKYNKKTEKFKEGSKFIFEYKIDFEKPKHFHLDHQLIVDNQSFKKPGLSAENLLDLMERLLRELCVGVKKLRPNIIRKVK